MPVWGKSGLCFLRVSRFDWLSSCCVSQIGGHAAGWANIWCFHPIRADEGKIKIEESTAKHTADPEWKDNALGLAKSPCGVLEPANSSLSARNSFPKQTKGCSLRQARAANLFR